ncbi:adenylyltransferase/sulfurtransferase [Natronospira proteinivora]|uniref:Adenylyltransferase/sulfurtransferase n=1 Tax=Natronospira proteinivora TaxID=1807133 RepID=A0ABT1G8P8_9GAMM|nr:HesA/MoeB/ThiF family protein [Natronospira proteinivora]MCP1727285.1 adenylyltransferase/sulfurtransferase [Natronospira proteinivora]
MKHSLERYARQSRLPEVGDAGQRRLAASRVLCIGAGGLGCGALPYLAGAGIGRITIIDDDQVEISNLQRQVLFSEADEGRPKAEAAAERLRALNGDIEIEAVTQRLDSGNIQALFEGHDVVIDGSDNFDTKFLAGDAAVKFGVPLVYGSVVGFEAQVTVFDPDQGPCLRCLFPSPPDTWVPNCAENGVLGPLVGMAASLQATQAIEILLGETGNQALSPLIGRLWMLDARDMDSRTLAIHKQPACPCCSRPPESIALPRAESSAGLNIPATEAAQLETVQFIDIREPDEWAREHIPGARNLPLSQLLAGETPTIKKDEVCVVYCAQGVRGETAARLLAEQGLDSVKNLSGGLAAWPGPREQA